MAPRRRPRRGSARSGPGSALRELLGVVLVAVVMSWLLKTFLVQAFFIPSGSMERTLLVGDRIVVEKLTPDLNRLNRGQVVVFADPGGWLDDPRDARAELGHEVPGQAADGGVGGGGTLRRGLEFLGLVPADSGRDLVKRIVGVAGDHVVCCDAKGRITVNGEVLREPYVYRGDAPSELPFDVRVPEASLWVMGDHRSFSQDSRYHQKDAGGGFVPVDDVVGRAFVVAWPIERVGRVRVDP